MMYLVFGKGGWGQLPHWLCWPTRKNNAISLRFSIWGSIQSASPSHNNAVNEQKCPKNKIGITSEAAIPVKKQGVGGNSSLKAKRKSRHHRMQKQHTSQVKYEQCLSSCLKEHEIKAHSSHLSKHPTICSNIWIILVWRGSSWGCRQQLKWCVCVFPDNPFSVYRKRPLIMWMSTQK